MSTQNRLFGIATSTQAPDEEADRWHLITTPFLWSTGLEGDMTIHGRTVGVDLIFRGILLGLQVRWY